MRNKQSLPELLRQLALEQGRQKKVKLAMTDIDGVLRGQGHDEL